MASKADKRKKSMELSRRTKLLILSSLCFWTFVFFGSFGNEDQVEIPFEEQENQIVPNLAHGTWIGGGAQPNDYEDEMLEDQLTDNICRNSDPLLYLLLPEYAKDCAKPMEKIKNNLAKPSLEEDSTDIDQHQRVLDTIGGMGQVLATANDQLCDCKMVTDMLGAMLQTAVDNPDLFHYALFSDNVLVASVVVRSTVMNVQDPSQHVFHLVIDTLNFRALSMWFRLNPPDEVIIQAQRFRGFARLDSSHSPVLRQLESAATKKLYLKEERSQSVESCSDSENPKYWNPVYFSILDRLRSFVLKNFPKLEKVLFPQDHFAFLWSINLEGIVDGAVKTCGGTFNHLGTYLKFRDHYISESFGNAIIIKALNWREQDALLSVHSQISEKVCGVINTTTSNVDPLSLDTFRKNILPTSWKVGGKLDNEILVSSEKEKDNFPKLEDRHISRKDEAALDLIVLRSEKPVKKSIQDMINSCNDGLKIGKNPELTKEGTGGTYFLKDSSGKVVGVFKPSDEEPGAVNNPRRIIQISQNGEGAKKGTKVGEGAVREVAAYLLDHDGFAGVPPTVMVECLHMRFNHPNGLKTKSGSLQMFFDNQGSLEDIGTSDFPVEEVHKISVLDLRLANTDRHGGNILKTTNQDGKIIFIPIDHGYTLPATFEECTFEWVGWPQAKEPYSPETRYYIRKLDAESDLKLLKSHGWDVPVEAARALIVSTRILQKGNERGLTASDIGSLMSRQTWDKKSLVEEILEKAQEKVKVLPETSESDFLQAVFDLMDHYFNDLVASQEL